MKLSAFLLLALALHARAQYQITFWTVDAGGGQSTGGAYAITGTVGQHDTGAAMIGGTYSLLGGFWALPFAVQTPGTPTLSIMPFGPGQARVSWVPNTPGFVLQETLSLSPTNWLNSPSGSANPVTVPATIPTKFYRLNKP